MLTPNLNEVIARLERLSADSAWAHRASGIRRSLIRIQEKAAEGAPNPNEQPLRGLLQAAYAILEAAAREIPERRPEAAVQPPSGQRSPDKG